MKGKIINTDPVLQEEQNYFEEVSVFLDQEVKQIEAKCKDLMEDSKLSYTGSSEERRHVQYLRKQAANEREKIKEIEGIKEKPYFARMDFNLSDEGQVEYQKVYIGEQMVADEGRVLVYDWRSDIGNRYYIKNETSFLYNQFRYELLLRRTLDIINYDLRGYEDEYNEGLQLDVEGIEDPFLLRTLRENREKGKLTDIIRTIQHNQNEIIRAPLQQHMIIQGCAGSGKTMILLHRLSYLFFQNTQLQEYDIKIITPNEMFNKHIEELIIKLGVNKAKHYSIREYYEKKIEDYNLSFRSYEIGDEDAMVGLATYFYSYETKKKLKEVYQEWYEFIRSETKRLNIKKWALQVLEENYEEKLIAKENVELLQYLIHKIYTVNTQNRQKYSDIQERLSEVGIRLEELSQEIQELQKLIQNKKIIYNKQVNQKLEKEKHETYKKSKVLEEEYTSELFRLKSIILEEQIVQELLALKKALPLDMRFLESDIYNKLRRTIFKEHKTPYIAKRYKFDMYCLLQLAYLYRGSLRNNKDRYLYIDEAQDLGVYEYELFYNINDKKCYFSLYGDVNQLIDKEKGIKSWNMLELLFRFEYFNLIENYRNTTQIIQYCKEKVGFDIVPIGLQGKQVSHYKFNLSGIREAIEEIIMSKAKRRVIIINQGNEDLYKMVVSQLPKGSYQRVQNSEEHVNSNKLLIFNVEMVKGLEFDHVLVFTKGMNRNSKYIAFTRALTKLSIVSKIEGK